MRGGDASDGNEGGVGCGGGSFLRAAKQRSGWTETVRPAGLFPARTSDEHGGLCQGWLSSETDGRMLPGQYQAISMCLKLLQLH